MGPPTGQHSVYRALVDRHNNGDATVFPDEYHVADAFKDTVYAKAADEATNDLQLTMPVRLPAAAPPRQRASGTKNEH
jgi:hypothetical protein